jgi:hypothetical protein
MNITILRITCGKNERKRSKSKSKKVKFHFFGR